jgi:hypothetical protein
MSATDKIIQEYLNFSGYKSYLDFIRLHLKAKNEREKHKEGSKEYVALTYIMKKLNTGMVLCSKHGGAIDVIIEDTIEDIERGYDEAKDLGKIVDHGKVTKRGKSDQWWEKHHMKIIFTPANTDIRVGEKIPASYEYWNMRYLEAFYGLRAFEFGNWLSQQDRENYLQGLGLALFDLHKALGFKPTQLGIKGKLAVAFGARGQGKARAHLEAGSYTINLTRYKRPVPLKKRSENFSRVDLILKDGGIGSFAHEYGHALDYFGGQEVEKGDYRSLSGDDSIDPKPIKELLTKNTLRGLMEKLMFKIIWKSQNVHTPYYTRMRKAAGKQKYFYQRAEIFARAFEVYVDYKLQKKKHKNYFLNKRKYSEKLYLTFQEMKKLEPLFDTLINALKKHL